MTSKTDPTVGSHADSSTSKSYSETRFLAPSELDLLRLDWCASPVFEALLRAFPGEVRLPETLPPSRAGTVPGMDSFTSVPAPHLRVSFVLTEMSHHVVSGGGVPASFVFWQGQNGDADQQLNGPFALPVPGPGQTWPVPADHANGIYQALTLDACGLSVSFPVTLESWIVETDQLGLATGDEIGRVTLSDNSTIDRPQNYIFGYVIRANGTNGGVSDFEFRGLVSVRCTASAAL